MVKKKTSKKASKQENKEHDISPDALPVSETIIKRVEPDEYYKARFDECVIGEGKFGQYARLVFTILSGNIEDSDESAKDLRMSALCPANITPNNSAWPLMKGITGKDPEVNEAVDITPFYGKIYKVMVSDGKAKPDGFISQNITKIKKYVRKAK